MNNKIEFKLPEETEKVYDCINNFLIDDKSFISIDKANVMKTLDGVDTAVLYSLKTKFDQILVDPDLFKDDYSSAIVFILFSENAALDTFSLIQSLHKCETEKFKTGCYFDNSLADDECEITVLGVK